MSEARPLTSEALDTMIKEDPPFAKSIEEARNVWEKFFAGKYDKKISKDEFGQKLRTHARLEMFTAEDLTRMDAEGSLVTRELFGKAPQEQYADAGEKHIQSLQKWLDRDEIKTPVILAEISGQLVMLDGDHRAMAATIKGRRISALIVSLDV